MPAKRRPAPTSKPAKPSKSTEVESPAEPLPFATLAEAVEWFLEPAEAVLTALQNAVKSDAGRVARITLDRARESVKRPTDRRNESPLHRNLTADGWHCDLVRRWYVFLDWLVAHEPKRDAHPTEWRRWQAVHELASKIHGNNYTRADGGGYSGLGAVLIDIGTLGEWRVNESVMNENASRVATLRQAAGIVTPTTAPAPAPKKPASASPSFHHPDDTDLLLLEHAAAGRLYPSSLAGCTGLDMHEKTIGKRCLKMAKATPPLLQRGSANRKSGWVCTQDGLKALSDRGRMKSV